MIWLLINLMFSQTLAPAPINLKHEVIQIENQRYTINFNGRELELLANGYVKDNGPKKEIDINAPPSDKFNWFACGGCLCAILICAAFWGSIIWLLFK